MSNKLFKLSTILIIAAILMAACGKLPGGAGAAGTPTALPPVVSAGEIVVDGRVVPNKSVDLAFNTSGEIAEVLVAEGDNVKAGDVIARLGNRETLESNVSKASLDLLSAQQEQLDAEQARQELFDTLSTAQTNALQELNDARQALKDADRKVAGLSTDPTQADLEEAQATLILTKDKLDKAEKDYKEYANRSEKNLIRAAMLNKVSQARRDYDNAVRRYNNILKGSTEFSQNQALAEQQIAQSRLAQAQKDYDELQQGPDPDKLALAESRIETAKGRIAAAETAQAAAQAALADLDLVATIPGTITKMDLIAGQRVSPGEVVAQIADFSKWYVETDNLTEIDVVNVAKGQNATVTPDAVPELVLKGVVEKISDNFEEKRGDITYTARILLDQVDPRLRWGMTTVVKFEK
jgi:multidrug efflux pump subunit AcrA (membrane-fusion protein)